MNFWKDHSDHGPFNDGRIVESGLVFDGEIRFEDRPNGFGGVSPVPVGRFVHATRETRGKTTTVTTHGDWMTR